MKKAFFSLICIMVSLIASAQSKSIVATYTKNVSIPSEIEAIPDPAIRETAIRKLKEANSGKYCAYTNGKEYAFTQSKNITNENINIQDAGACYIDITRKEEIRINNIIDKPFTVQSDYEASNWKITRDKQTIGDYQCRKAVNEDTGFEAWFTTDIPVGIGPNGIINLPGAIIKLKTPSYEYVLDEINEVGDMTLNMPKGKVIAKQEFNDIKERRLKQLGVNEAKGTVQIITL